MRRRSFVCLPVLVAVFSIWPTAPRAEALAPGGGSLAISSHIDHHLRMIRERARDLASAATRVPSATAAAAAALVADEETTPLGLAIRLALLWVGGSLGQLLFWRWSAAWMQRIVDSQLTTARQRLVAQAQRLMFAQGVVLTFATGACLAYLVAAPPAAAGVMALDALLAIVAVRTARVVGRFLYAPGGPRLRLVAMPTAAAWRVQHSITALSLVLAIGFLWSALLRLGSADPAVADAVMSLTMLLVALLVPAAVAMVLLSVRRSSRDSGRHAPRPAAVALAVVPVTAWFLAQAGLPTAAWAVMVLGLAPALSTALGDAARTIGFGPNRSGTLTREERIVARAARNIALIAALLLLINGAPGSGGGFGLSLATKIASALLILLGTDLAWQVAHSVIDRGLAHVGSEARADRLATVLPALRTFVFIVLAVTAVLSVASALGLQIGPLLAGAGVVGLTIGFGAQTLVRDVIAGFFLLLDDAFRIGETIETGTLQGQVEAFSLRSVRLRDDTGHMHTIAFGELKAVTNFSRDWAALEVPVYLPHGANYAAAADVIEAAIATVTADEALAPVILAPPRFLGATALSESSIRLAILIRTQPGNQARVRSELLHHVLAGMAAADIPLGRSPTAV